MSLSKLFKRLELSTIIGVLIILYSIYALSTNLTFLYQANISKGEIINANCESAHTGRFNHIICGYTIKFHTFEDNQPHLIIKRFASNHGYQISDEVTLVYETNKPNRASLYDETLWLFPFCLLTIGLFFTLIPHLK